MISVYVALSLDGFIAGPDDDLDWLDEVAHPEGDDYGYGDFMARVDALVMGRRTFEVVLGLAPWHYEKPVFVLSNTLSEVPEDLVGKVGFVRGSPESVVAQLAAKGHRNLYIDGGRTVSSFLESDLVDELILTRFPVLLGAGVPLFGPLTKKLAFAHRGTKQLSDVLTQDVYARMREPAEAGSPPTRPPSTS